MEEYNTTKPNIESSEEKIPEPEIGNPEIQRSENIDLELEKLGKNELKYLNRTELLEILLDYAKENERLKQEAQQLEQQLQDKKLKISKFGSIAEASLELNGVFEAAEASCTQYLENAKMICDRQIELSGQKLEEAEKQAAEIIENAKKGCEDIEGQKATLLSDTLIECEKMKKQTENECRRKIAAVNRQCEEKIANTEKQVNDNWNMLSRRLEDFYASHKGLMELINQGILNIPGRGKVNET